MASAYGFDIAPVSAVAEGDGKNSPGAELLAKERGRSL